MRSEERFMSTQTYKYYDYVQENPGVNPLPSMSLPIHNYIQLHISQLQYVISSPDTE
jgi:hypothetical protein